MTSSDDPERPAPSCERGDDGRAEPSQESRDDGRVTVALRVAYEGGPFHGFVAQPGQPTVAGALLAAIQTLDGGVSRLRCASRTDAGVHARAQLVAFDTTRELAMRSWVLALNERLPDSVAVRGAYAAAPRYEPRFDVEKKRYRYLVHTDRVRCPMLHERSWRVPALADCGDVELERMDAELASARGCHDFAAFASARDRREHTARTMLETRVVREAFAARLIGIEVTGDGFLHNMVRILVGTVVDVARGALAPGAITRALASKQRRDAGQTAPAHGLCLEEVWQRTPFAGDAWPR